MAVSRRRAGRGGPPIPSGPPGSNWQSSQTSLNGSAEAGPSGGKATSSSYKGSPARFGRQRGPSSGQQRARGGQRWSRDDYPMMARGDAQEDHQDYRRSARSLTPPKRRDSAQSRDLSPADKESRFSDRIASRDRSVDEDSLDERYRRYRDVEQWPTSRREPVWSDNRRHPRPSPRWEPPPSVMGKRSRHNADHFDRPPQDSGWSSRPNRSLRQVATGIKCEAEADYSSDNQYQ